jgi:hypothetical protein
LSSVSSARWIVVVRGETVAKTCARIRDGEGPGADHLRVLVVATRDNDAGFALCSSSELREERLPSSAARGLRNAVPFSGFIVLDRERRVSYGSYDFAYLRRVTTALALFDTTAQAPDVAQP